MATTTPADAPTLRVIGDPRVSPCGEFIITLVEEVPSDGTRKQVYVEAKPLGRSARGTTRMPLAFAAAGHQIALDMREAAQRERENAAAEQA